MLRGEGTALDRVRLLAPIPEPHQDVVCLGMNYIDHSAEAERWGKEDFVKNAGKAVYFSKRAAYIVGPGGEIDPHFDIVDGLDYEAELAVVLGKDAYRVSKDEAFDYVLGYSVLNDVSALQPPEGAQAVLLRQESGHPYHHGALDRHARRAARRAGAGHPLLHKRREAPGQQHPLYDLRRRRGHLGALQGMTLKAGTIIAMGTPAGVGMGFDPPKYLACGDVVRCEIDGIGVLENRVKK